MMLNESLDRASVALIGAHQSIWLKMFGGASYFVVGFFRPISGFLLATFIMIMIDFITGIASAHKKLEEKKRSGATVTTNDMIRSRRMVDTVVKLGIFVLVIVGVEAFRLLLLHDLETYFGVKRIPITMLVAGVITVAEMQSIRENIFTMYGFDLFAFVPKKIRKLFSTTKIDKQ